MLHIGLLFGAILVATASFPSAAAAQERQLGSDGDVKFSIPLQYRCETTAPVTVTTPDPSLFSEDQVRLQRLLGLIRVALGFECPAVSIIEVTGVARGRHVYSGIATAANDWRLASTQGASIQPARIEPRSAEGKPQWRFAQAVVEGAQIASINLERDGALLLTVRCMASPGYAPVRGVDPRAGVLTFQFNSSITGPYIESARSIELTLGGHANRWPLVFDESAGVYSLMTTLTKRHQEHLQRGARFYLNAPETGRLNAPIPQAEGLSLLAACGQRGIDATAKPSFDCDLASNGTEQAICSVPKLAEMDQRLAAAYQTAPENIKASQRVWLEARNGCRADVHCIEGMIAERIAVLGDTQDFSIPATPALRASAELPLFTPVGQAQPAVDRLIGNEAVLDTFLLWAIGQNPQLAAESPIQRRLSQYSFPQGLPEVSPRRPDPAKAQARLEAAGALFANKPPVDVILEWPMNIEHVARDPQSPLRISGVNSIGDSAAITQITLPDHKFSGGSIGLQLFMERPFLLPVPDEFTPVPTGMIGSRKGKTLARVYATLTEHVPDVQENRYRGGKAQAELHSVSFVYRPVMSENGSYRDGPDQVLHVWQNEERQNVKIPRPSDALETARIFGGGASDGRYVLNASRLRDTVGERPKPLLQASSPEDGFVLAMQLAALTAAQPERPLDPELAQHVMRSLLSEQERTDLFPLNIATTIRGNVPSELELRAALSANEETMRQRVRDRSPELPLAIRFVGTGGLGEYNFESGGFPMSLSSNSGTWLPTDRDGIEIIKRLPDFLPVRPEDAQALIDRLSSGSSSRGRLLALVIDYNLEGVVTRPGRTGPITKQEASSVQPILSSISIALYPQSDLSQPVHIIPLPDGFEASAFAPTGDADNTAVVGALPDELFLTTGKSLLAAIERLDESGEIIEQAILGDRSLSRSPSATFEARKAAFRDELRQMARDSYWVGASLAFGSYDPNLGGFPITQLNFNPVGHSEDFDGVKAPSLRPAASEDYAVLRVPADMAEAVVDSVGRKRSTNAYLRVEPVGTIYDRKKGAFLLVSAPLEAIFEKTTSFSLPRRSDIRVSLGVQDRLGPALGDDPKSIDPPEALLLDPEGIDLLALSQAPDLYDDAMYRRMLVDRLLKERATQPGTSGAPDLDGRRFFKNPDQPLRADTMDSLLPAFRDWTLARAAALPNVVLLPIGAQSHPLTGCRGMNALTQKQVDMNHPFLQANLPALLGPNVILSQRLPRFYSSSRPKPGPDTVLHWEGGGKNGGGRSCGYVASSLRSLDRGTRPEEAQFISAVIVVRAQPPVSPVSEQPESYLYRLSVGDLRVVPAAELQTAPEGLAGLVVLTTEVDAATAYRSDKSLSGYKTVGEIKAGDWDPVVATPPANMDILGLALETPLADFEAAMRQRMPNAANFATVVPGKSMFGHATAFIDTETSEAMVAIYADHVKGKPVIAFTRRLELDASEVSVDALKITLEEKYGAEYRVLGENYLYWGALPQEEDRYGYCGASLFGGLNYRALPILELTNADALGDRKPGRADQFLREFGWPDDFDQKPAQLLPDITQCAPLVAVKIIQTDRKLHFVTWLFDRALAVRLNKVPRPAPVKANTEL